MEAMWKMRRRWHSLAPPLPLHSKEGCVWVRNVWKVRKSIHTWVHHPGPVSTIIVAPVWIGMPYILKLSMVSRDTALVKFTGKQLWIITDLVFCSIQDQKGCHTRSKEPRVIKSQRPSNSPAIALEPVWQISMPIQTHPSGRWLYSQAITSHLNLKDQLPKRKGNLLWVSHTRAHEHKLY